MRNLLRVAWLFATLAASFGLFFFVASRGGGGGDHESDATPTAGAFMPWAVATAPPIAAGTVPWPSATGSATATATPTPSPPTLTPDERAEAEALLKAASLRPEDIPEGFFLEFDMFTTNEELAELGELFAELLAPIGGVGLEELEEWGRVLGYSQTYGLEGAEEPDPASFSGTAGFQVNVELFRDSGDASRYFEMRSEDYSNPEDRAAWKDVRELFERAGLEWRDLTISQVSFPAVGDERIAAEVAATLHVSELDLDVEYAIHAVTLRRGPTVATINIEAFNSVPRAGELEDLARALDERMKDALE